MRTWTFIVRLNCSLVEFLGLVIEKTEVAYLKSFPCIVVKTTFQVTCGVERFQIQKMKLVLFCRLPVSADLEPKVCVTTAIASFSNDRGLS